MKRRKFIKLASSTVAATLTPKSLLSATSRKNVLFITIDDLNNWLSCLGGHLNAQTPNFDRLAKKGMLFTNAHAPAPICNPARVSVMTGFFPSTSGIYFNQDDMRALLPNVITIPQHFKANGYYTAGVGKIFHRPDPQSWDEYFKPNFLKRRVPALNKIEGLPDNDLFDWGSIDLAENEMPDWKTVEWASEKLTTIYDKPLFLGVGFRLPHLPWYLPKKHFDKYDPDLVILPSVRENDLEDVPAIAKKWAADQPTFHLQAKSDHQRIIESGQWGQAVAAYLACISFVDSMLGKLLDAFEQSSYADNTIIILWSDGGYHLGEKHHWRKFALWEESTQSPLMIVANGITKPETRCHKSVSLTDIYPTLIDLCGLTPKSELEGNSLLPLLLNPESNWKNVALSTYGMNNHAIRSECWRYIRYYDGTEELYNHNNDPHEWINLADNPNYKEIKECLSVHFPKFNHS